MIWNYSENRLIPFSAEDPLEPSQGPLGAPKPHFENHCISELCMFSLPPLLLLSCLEPVSMVPSPEQSQPSPLAASDSQADTIILPASDSPSSKRQRLDAEAKQVRMNTPIQAWN